VECNEARVISNNEKAKSLEEIFDWKDEIPSATILWTDSADTKSTVSECTPMDFGTCASNWWAL
jgi:hypothetical protein